LNLFQEAAVEDYPMSREELLRHNQVWIITRVAAEILTYPVRGQTVTVETWQNAPNTLHVERGYVIKNADGRVLVNGGARWCLLNPVTRKPIGMKDCACTDYPCTPAPCPVSEAAGNLGKIAPVGINAVKAYDLTALPGDMDCNRHVNNAAYADFVFNAFTAAELERDITFFALNYVRELQCNECASVFREALSADKYLTELKTPKGTSICRAETIFAQR
jgi:acyl-ACP thioesterase